MGARADGTSLHPRMHGVEVHLAEDIFPQSSRRTSESSLHPMCRRPDCDARADDHAIASEYGRGHSE